MRKKLVFKIIGVAVVVLAAAALGIYYKYRLAQEETRKLLAPPTEAKQAQLGKNLQKELATGSEAERFGKVMALLADKDENKRLKGVSELGKLLSSGKLSQATIDAAKARLNQLAASDPDEFVKDEAASVLKKLQSGGGAASQPAASAPAAGSGSQPTSQPATPTP